MEERDYSALGEMKVLHQQMVGTFARAGEAIRRTSEMLHDAMRNAVKCADPNMDVPPKVRLTKPKRDRVKIVAKRKAAKKARKKSK